jgi:hypothetical protein
MIHLIDFFNPIKLCWKLTFFGGGDSPPPPDYEAAAKAQGAANLQAAIASGIINNPNVLNPFGTQQVTWEYKYKTDKNGNPLTGSNNIIAAIPTIKQNFSPDQQALYNQSIAAKKSLAGAGTSLAGNIARSGLDLSGLPGAPQNSGDRRQEVIDAMMSRVSTDIAGKRDQINSDLIAAGIRPGTRAYDAQMDALNRQENDARQQAILAGGQEATRDFGMDMQTRQNALAELLTKRQTPLNELNAIMSGSQVNNPFAGGLGYQAGANVQAAPVANAIAQQGQAAINQYNSSQAALNGNISAGAGLLGSLGSAFIMRPGA